MDPEETKKLIDITQVRDSWDAEKFLQTLRYQESVTSLEEMKDGLEYWQQNLGPMQEINKILKKKSIQLKEIFKDKELADICKNLKLSADYYSNGSIRPIFKASKLILLYLVKQTQDPLINFILHVLFLTYMNVEKLNEIMLNRLAGYNLFEREFQDLMVKDFKKFEEQIQQMEGKIKTTQDEIAKLNLLNQNLAFTQRRNNDDKIFGLIRKANGRINGLVKRIESLEDGMDESNEDGKYSQTENASDEGPDKEHSSSGQGSIKTEPRIQNRTISEVSDKEDSKEWEEVEEEEDEQEEDEEEVSNEDCVLLMEEIQRKTTDQVWHNKWQKDET